MTLYISSPEEIDHVLSMILCHTPGVDAECGELHPHRRSTGPQLEDVDDDTDDVVPIDQLLSDAPRERHFTPPDLSLPTNAGITLELARSRCRTSVNQSAVYEVCLDVLNITETIERCATDAMV